MLHDCMNDAAMEWIAKAEGVFAKAAHAVKAKAHTGRFTEIGIMTEETNDDTKSWTARFHSWWWSVREIDTNDENKTWWVILGIIAFGVALDPFSGMVFSWGTAFALEKPGFKWFPVIGTILAMCVGLFFGNDGLIHLHHSDGNGFDQ